MLVKGLGVAGSVSVVAAAVLAVGVALGGASRLTYHEAIGAQAGGELLAGGDPLVPTLGGRPWLEKPPLGIWLIAAAARLAGGVGEAAARLPSAVAAAGVALAVGAWAARRFGSGVGLLAGGVQATTAWAVTRGRLAEADILLAAVVAGALIALDRVREGGPWRSRWVFGFFALVGMTALLKGIGFGAALVGAATLAVLAWDRDRATARALVHPVGWGVAALVALAWPLLVLARYPEVLALWTAHVTDRLASRPEQFAGEPWWEYAASPLVQTLPWTPLALAGAWGSWRRARREPGGPDRLLWAWAVVPAVLVSLASVRNAHYLIHALPPWSVWAALTLARLGERLAARGWPRGRLRRGAVAGFVVVGLAYGLGFAWLGPRLDRRGAEWGWYATAAGHLRLDERLVLLYDDWDRRPYPTPFGPVPHDLAVRLFYLGRPATWRRDLDGVATPCAVIARERDRPAIRQLGRVAEVARGPATRWDRAFVLYRVEAGKVNRRDAGVAMAEEN